MAAKRQTTMFSYMTGSKEATANADSEKSSSDDSDSDMSVQEDTALPPEKQPRLSNVKQRSFRSAWLSEYSWLVYENENMTCNVCTRAGKKNPFTSGCTNFQNSILMRHKISKDHVESVKVLEMQKHFKTSTSNAVEVERTKHLGQQMVRWSNSYVQFMLWQKRTALLIYRFNGTSSIKWNN